MAMGGVKRCEGTAPQGKGTPHATKASSYQRPQTAVSGGVTPIVSHKSSVEAHSAHMGVL